MCLCVARSHCKKTQSNFTNNTCSIPGIGFGVHILRVRLVEDYLFCFSHVYGELVLRCSFQYVLKLVSDLYICLLRN